MTKLLVQAGTNSGCVFYVALPLPDDYTMLDVVRACRSRGYDYFRICDTMHCFVNI